MSAAQTTASQTTASDATASDPIVADPIVADTLGGAGSPLHLAHANGYPPASYRGLVEHLGAHFTVQALRTRPLRPGTSPSAMTSWHQLADELVAWLDAEDMRDVVGVGHSLGGIVTMYAALARPERFRALALVEPVLLPPALLAQVGDPDEAAQRIGLVRVALQRRTSWPSHEDAFAHFRPKPVFARISDEVLWDYVRGGLIPDSAAGADSRSASEPAPAAAAAADGDAATDVALAADSVASAAAAAAAPNLTLAFPREWEARIYSTPPTDVWDLLPRLSVPTLALRGATSDTINIESWRRWQTQQPEARFVNLDSVGHLLPFEAPERVAAEILDFVDDLR